MLTRPPGWSRPDAAAPTGLTRGEARLLFAPFAEADTLLLAVSGGPDSIALMRLAASLAEDLPALAVATVDHGLREGSRAVADAVAADAAALGLPVRILTWDGPKPGARLQERARDHRYRLLTACARDLGASHIATAHTLDDQVETVLMRLGRGSGPAGLAGMQARSLRDGIVHLRPFLAVSKRRILATCQAAGWRFIDDPANTDPRFARSRLRRIAPLLAEEGFGAERIAVLARRMAEAAAAIDASAGQVLGRAARADRPGHYHARLLIAQPSAVLHRALERMLAGDDPGRRARLERVERLAAALREAAAGGHVLRRTLSGKLVDYDGGDALSVGPEPPRRRAGARPPPPPG